MVNDPRFGGGTVAQDHVAVAQGYSPSGGSQLRRCLPELVAATRRSGLTVPTIGIVDQYASEAPRPEEAPRHAITDLAFYEDECRKSEIESQ